ncbi:hypothetical protein Tco_1527800, partial [Tanacetum coccineum]
MSIGIVAHEIDKYFELVVSCDDEVQNPLLELESGPIGPPRPFIDGWHNSSIDRGACPLGLTTGGGPLFGGGGGPAGGGP